MSIQSLVSSSQGRLGTFGRPQKLKPRLKNFVSHKFSGENWMKIEKHRQFLKPGFNISWTGTVGLVQ